MAGDSEHEDTKTGPGSIALALLVIRVIDLARAEAFYAAVGLSLRHEQHGAGPDHVTSQVGAAVFEIYPRRDEDAGTAGVRLGFRVGSVDAAVTAAVAVGGVVIVAAQPSAWGRRAVLADPDGHRVELTERRA